MKQFQAIIPTDTVPEHFFSSLASQKYFRLIICMWCEHPYRFFTNKTISRCEAVDTRKHAGLMNGFYTEWRHFGKLFDIVGAYHRKSGLHVALFDQFTYLKWFTTMLFMSGRKERCIWKSVNITRKMWLKPLIRQELNGVIAVILLVERQSWKVLSVFQVFFFLDIYRKFRWFQSKYSGPKLVYHWLQSVFTPFVNNDTWLRLLFIKFFFSDIITFKPNIISRQSVNIWCHYR